MDELGRLQVYSSLYKMAFTAPPPAQGWMRGLVRFRDVAGQSDADGTLLWNITIPGGFGAPLEREPVNILASRITPGTTLENAFPSGLKVMVGDVTSAPSGTARATGNALAGTSPLQFNGALLSGNGTLRGHLGNSSAWTTWSGVNFPKQKTVFAQFRRFGRVIWGRPPVGSGALRLTGQ